MCIVSYGALGFTWRLITCSPDHGSGTSHETGSNLLQSAEVDPHATKEGIYLKFSQSAKKKIYISETYEHIANRDEDDQGEWIKIGQDIVRNAVKGHCSSLGSQIVVELHICQPYKAEN